MPTKAKTNPGFFERTGAKLDRGVSWVGAKINRIRKIYHTINSRYVSKIRAHKLSRILPSSLVVLLLFLVLIPIYLVQLLSNEVLIYDSTKKEIVTAYQELTEGEVSGDIQCEMDLCELSSIEIFFGTFQRSNHSEYEFNVKQDGEVIRSQTFSATVLEDNKGHNFNFEPVLLEKGPRYTFTLRALDVPEDNAIAVYYNSATGNIVYQASGRSDYYLPVIIISAVFLVIFCFINFLINSGKIKTEFRYLAYTLLYILPLVFIYPVSTIPDENYHLGSALRLAQYDFNESFAHNMTAHHDIQLPANSYYLFGAQKTPRWSEVLDCFRSDSDTVTAERPQRMMQTHGVIAYAPAALGIMLGDLISDSPMVIYYFGRLFNLIAVILVVVFALSLIKKHRMIFLAIILLPMFLQQAASYSYDGLLNACCILLIAYNIRFLTTDATIRKRDFVAIALSIFFIGLVKLPYLLIATPLLFIKSEKFGKYKAVKWLFLAGVFLVTVAAYAADHYLAVINTDGFPIEVSGRGLPLSSLNFRTIIKMLIRTFWFQGSRYITGLIGFFGWFYFAFNPIIVTSYIIFFIVLTLSDSEKLSQAMRLITLLAIIALAGSVFLAMYLSYTTAGAPYIEGVQGRYFLPLVPLLMLIAMPKKQKLDLPSTTSYSFINLILLCFILTLLVGFY